MKRLLLFTLALVTCFALAAPAQADLSSTNAGSAGAFWEAREHISGSRYRITSWYVGVYSGTDGTFSDVYKDVALCEITDEEYNCTSESWSYGYKELSSSEYSINPVLLDEAHLDAVYDVQTVDAEGNPAGDPVATRVVTDWTGDGRTQYDRGASFYSSGCFVYAGAFTGAYRNAQAVGAFGASKLGDAAGAGLGLYLGADVFEGC